MDSLFGRSSCFRPYDKLAPSPRAPVPVGSTSQGLRGSGVGMISAPITNPTLTSNGTELNKFAMSRSKAERDRVYEQHLGKRPGSPSTSISTAESSTLYSDSGASSSNNRMRRSEASFSTFLRLAREAHLYRILGLAPLMDPPVRSESFQSQHPHISQFYQTLVHPNEDFHFPRPERDEEIEDMFENVKLTRSLENIPKMSIDQKWHIVYNNELMKWEEEKKRDALTRKQIELGKSGVISEGAPECWFNHFLELQGASVLAQTLAQLRKTSRREQDIQLENEIVKILKRILNSRVCDHPLEPRSCFSLTISSGSNETNQRSAFGSTSCLVISHSPHSYSKVILEILTYFAANNEGEFQPLVVSALEALSTTQNESGCYQYWFRALEITLAGRGKMGSLVGASDEVKKSGAVEASLNEYAVRPWCYYTEDGIA
ncbi:armadillo-type protein [Salix suchowensis]|nr:armadillo-type protein [Salix suchowensis]